MPFSRLHRLVLASTCGLLVLLLAAPASLAHGLSSTASAACATITSFTPTSGIPGTSVTITGCGFTGATSVTFNGVPASFTVTADTQITTTVPAGASSGKLAVTTPTKIIKSAGKFTILRVPAAITLSPTAGPPTSPVTVSGVNFGNQEAVDVYFDTADQALAATTVQGAFSISIQVPVSAVPGTHWVTAIGRHSGLSTQTSFLVRTDWAQFRDDLRHTGLNPYENVLSSTNVARLDGGWTAAPGSGSPIFSSPSVANGMVYVGSLDTHLYAFDAQTGAQLWAAPTMGIIDSSPAVANGVVYVGSLDTHLYAFNAQTGTQLWTAATGGAIQSSPAVANGMVYVGSEDDRLYAFNAQTGAQLWTAGTGSFIDSSPAVANGVVYVGSDNGHLYAFNAQTGAQLWTVATGGEVRSSPAVANGVVYVGSQDTHLYAFNAQTGTQLWTVTTGGAIDFSSPAVANGVVYVGSFDAHLYAFNAQTGAQLWTAATGFDIFSSPAVANGIVYVGSDDGHLYAYTLPAGSQPQAPARPTLRSLHPDLHLHVSA